MDHRVRTRREESLRPRSCSAARSARSTALTTQPRCDIAAFDRQLVALTGVRTDGRHSRCSTLPQMPQRNLPSGTLNAECGRVTSKFGITSALSIQQSAMYLRQLYL